MLPLLPSIVRRCAAGSLAVRQACFRASKRSGGGVAAELLSRPVVSGITMNRASFLVGGVVMAGAVGHATCSDSGFGSSVPGAMEFSAEVNSKIQDLLEKEEYTEYHRTRSYPKSLTITTLKDHLLYRMILHRSPGPRKGYLFNRFSTNVEGPPNCVHGGAIATMLDVAQGVTANYYLKRCVTMKLEVSYRTFVPSGCEVVIETVVDDVSDPRPNGSRRATVTSKMQSPDGKKLYAECKGLWYLFPEDVKL